MNLQELYERISKVTRHYYNVQEGLRNLCRRYISLALMDTSEEEHLDCNDIYIDDIVVHEIWQHPSEGIITLLVSTGIDFDVERDLDELSTEQILQLIDGLEQII